MQGTLPQWITDGPEERRELTLRWLTEEEKANGAAEHLTKVHRLRLIAVSGARHSSL